MTDYMEQARALAGRQRDITPSMAEHHLARALEHTDMAVKNFSEECLSHEATKAELQTLRNQAQAMSDNLIAELRAEIERQRETRGDIMDYGQPDPLLVRCLEALTRAADALEPSGDVVERVLPYLCERHNIRYDYNDCCEACRLGASHAE